MRLINIQTFHALNDLVYQCLQLNINVVRQDLLRDISEGCKYTTMITQRNFLEHLIHSGGVTNEIRSLAMQKFLSVNRIRSEEIDIIKVRLNLKEKQIRKQKYIWIKASKLAENPFEGHWIRQKYRFLKKKEFNRVWFMETHDKIDKTAWLSDKVEDLTYHEGIPICDSELIQRYGDTKEEDIVLADIQTTEAIDAYLRLPPKFTTFSALDDKYFRIQAESTAAKQRWSKKEDNGEFVSFEDRLYYREQQESIRNPLQDNSVSFTRLKSTDFASNKRIGHPPTLDERQEILIEHQKALATEGFNEYSNKYAKGLASNLTLLEQQGLKEI